DCSSDVCSSDLVEWELRHACGECAQARDQGGAAGGDGGECVGGRRVHGASRPRGTVGGGGPFAALLAPALDPAMAARTNVVEAIATRLETIAVEVDADRPAAAAARTAAG